MGKPETPNAGLAEPGGLLRLLAFFWSPPARIIIGLGLATALMIALFPPWCYTYQRPGISQAVHPGPHAWLLSPPKPLGPYCGVRLDAGRLALEWAAVAVGAGLALLSVRVLRRVLRVVTAVSPTRILRSIGAWLRSHWRLLAWVCGGLAGLLILLWCFLWFSRAKPELNGGVERVQPSIAEFLEARKARTQDQLSLLTFDRWYWSEGEICCDVFNGSEATLRSLTFRVTFRREGIVLTRVVRSTIRIQSPHTAGSWTLPAGVTGTDLIKVELVGAEFYL